MKRLPIFAALLFACVLALVLSGQASAQEPTPPTDDQVNAIASRLYCPVCENIPLDVCPTQACIQWREVIRAKLAEGWSEDQIREYFATQYGDRALSEPPRRGLNWLVYVLPPVIVLGGLLLVAGVLRSMRVPKHANPAAPSADTPPTAQPDPADEYVRRLEEELKKNQ